jgi:glycosyltransferase involved in cell wall biosynthesis
MDLIDRVQPDIVHAHTPKAALVGMLAARAKRVRTRVVTIHGLKLLGAQGPRRALLTGTEALTYAMSTHLLAVSRSMSEWVRGHGLTRKPVEVLGDGSCNGIDGTFFSDRWSAGEKAAMRAELGLPADAFVFVFVGRIVRDKGIRELVGAFTRIHREFPATRLLVVGPDESHLDPISAADAEVLRSHPAIVCRGFAHDVRPFMAMSDALVLPTYREGFGMVLIEAGCLGVPVIATRIPGCGEVVVEGETGLLVEPRDEASLLDGMRRLLIDDALRTHLRSRARAETLRRYDQSRVWSLLDDFYLRALDEGHR